IGNVLGGINPLEWKTGCGAVFRASFGLPFGELLQFVGFPIPLDGSNMFNGFWIKHLVYPRLGIEPASRAVPLHPHAAPAFARPGLRSSHRSCIPCPRSRRRAGCARCRTAWPSPFLYAAAQAFLNS